MPTPAELQKNESDIQNVYSSEVERLYRYCFKFTQNQEDAQDALQTVFLKASQAERRPERRFEITPWLNTIARNTCLDLVRARRGHLIKDLDENTDSDQPSGWDRITDRTVNVEDRLGWQQLLRVAAADLTPQERMAVELVHGDGFTRREAGLLLRIQKPYPFVATAERKLIKRITRLAGEGDRNARSLLLLLPEDHASYSEADENEPTQAK